ncbi:chemotaxis protein [Thauera sinica]|uniref:Chemotaxis protein n=1 Tax=Thauera sinica TaxID=2665146 RepID=A0ABW1AMI8_9RHOO|nr:chemotaxis protein [Thauera sp. K11]ATE60633.1 fused signal transduction protein/response regulator [Thauera sp. K11]
MSDLLKNIDARTRLAGTNKLEILLFTLGVDERTGRRETFGINVFKVREVMRTPAITAAPEMPSAVQGMVSLRGELVPVVDLASYVGIGGGARDIMIVTEYNGHTQGFLVENVDTILRLDWSQMRVPPGMLVAKMGGLVTAVTELADNRLVMMLDVERVLSETTRYDDELLFREIVHLPGADAHTVYFADDSSVARRQISQTLDAMGVRHIGSVNGRQAWEELKKVAAHAQAHGRAIKDFVSLVLTDVEMPEMDGYILTKHIKSDRRFEGIPVIMHSSLSGMSNQQLGRSVGVDEYVSKFEPQRLAQTIGRLLAAGDAAREEN